MIIIFFENIKGKKILISLGGTYEAIDPVRYITNKSSGKMGLELAKQAYIRGADLTLLVANVSVNIPKVFNVIYVESTQDMCREIENLISDFDIFISTAAISDFMVDYDVNYKISSESLLNLTFKPTVKIIHKIKKLNPEIFLVGFKAEYNISEEKIINCAKKQIEMAGTDLVVANDVGHENCYFGSNKNEVLIISDEILKVPLASKKEIASVIFDVINEKL